MKNSTSLRQRRIWFDKKNWLENECTYVNIIDDEIVTYQGSKA